MKANPVINPATGASGDVIVDASQADKVYVFTNTNALGAGESVTASLPNTANGKTGAVDNFGALASITNSSVAPCMILEGGATYFITKSATAAAVGVDVAFKPRQM